MYIGRKVSEKKNERGVKEREDAHELDFIKNLFKVYNLVVYGPNVVLFIRKEVDNELLDRQRLPVIK